MSELINMIREYLEVSDKARLLGLRDGTMSIDEAKKDAAEAELWLEKLRILEAQRAVLE